jgi:hypothetical protein
MALVFGLNRIRLVAALSPVWVGWPSAFWLAAAGGTIGALSALWLARRSDRTRAWHLLGALQLALPWGFLIVLPMPWVEADGRLRAFPTGAMPAAALTLVLIAYLDLLRRWSRAQEEHGGRAWSGVLSPICFAAAILVFRLTPALPAHVPLDDYHYGEWALPWWTWASEGMLPFRDYVPARGLVNYSNGAVAALLGDPSSPFIQMCSPLVVAVFFVAALAATAGLVGTPQAAAMFALIPFSDRLTDIDFVATALLMVGWRTFDRGSGLRWSLAWIAVAIPVFLFAPGQALLLAVATAPLLLWQMGRAVVTAPRLSRNFAIGTTALLAGAVLLTALGPMLLGAWRYVVENGAVVGPAYGVDWSLSVGTLGAGSYWLAEAVRSSFILVPIACVALLGGRLLDRDWARAGRLAVVAVPVLLLGLLYIPRAAGRIDPGAPSRLFVASIWMQAMLLPVVFHAAWGSRQWPSILAFAVFVMGALSSIAGGVDLRVLAPRAIPSAPVPATLIKGEAFGLPALGLADVDPLHLTRLVRLRRAIDALLEPGETYLDLTNRNTNYFYFNRRPPIESGAPYNLPNEAQQVRAIRRLEAAPVPVVLAQADSMLHDGGPPSVRDHAFYRYVVQRYLPVRIDGYIFLIRGDRLTRASALAERASGQLDAVTLLDQVFRPPPLELLPAAWGQSWESLSEDATFVRSLSVTGAGGLRLDGGIAGRDAGLLVLETSCDPAPTGSQITVSWIGNVPSGEIRFRSGARLVVPLDASPRWLLAQQVTALQLQSSNAACGPAAVLRAELWQRRVAEVTDPRR